MEPEGSRIQSLKRVKSGEIPGPLLRFPCSGSGTRSESNGLIHAWAVGFVWYESWTLGEIGLGRAVRTVLRYGIASV